MSALTGICTAVGALVLIIALWLGLGFLFAAAAITWEESASPAVILTRDLMLYARLLLGHKPKGNRVGIEKIFQLHPHKKRHSTTARWRRNMCALYVRQARKIWTPTRRGFTDSPTSDYYR